VRDRARRLARLSVHQTQLGVHLREQMRGLVYKLLVLAPRLCVCVLQTIN
jgi:hypothetical protein